MPHDQKALRTLTAIHFHYTPPFAGKMTGSITVRSINGDQLQLEWRDPAPTPNVSLRPSNDSDVTGIVETHDGVQRLVLSGNPDLLSKINKVLNQKSGGYVFLGE